MSHENPNAVAATDATAAAAAASTAAPSTADSRAETCTEQTGGDHPADVCRLPPVQKLVDSLTARGWADRVGRSVVVDVSRGVLEGHRCALVSQSSESQRPTADDITLEACTSSATDRLEQLARPPLTSIINATGIIIHTGLGRAPLPERAVEALVDVAAGYASVEVDLSTGKRGRRTAIVEPLLRELTGAESATVTNNNAAALLLVLSTLARDRGVIVSRGELIEIGGSFRLPEVIAAGGAIQREVGTTNKTRLGDYEAAIDDSAAVLLKVHTSNYRVEGFTAAVGIGELAALGHRHGLVVIHDIGSGLVTSRATDPGSPLAGEPDARTSIAAGADLVLFSGDKLLGGPQAGIIVGRADLIRQLEANPLMRALRVDKLTLAALGATLQLHRDPEFAVRCVPVLAALATPVKDLRRRAKRLAAELELLAGIDRAQAVDSLCHLGGGAVPAQAVPSVAVQIDPLALSVDELALRLRTGTPAVMGMIREGSLRLDLRTVPEKDDLRLIRAVTCAVAG